MLKKRIIPCLDVKDGKVVKGINFIDLKFAGSPVILAKKYYEENADEIVLLDITASNENRKTMIDIVKKVAKEIFIPLTVGGGINSINDIRDLLNAGADKVSINSFAIKNPNLIKEASKIFGSQCIVIAIDAKKKEDSWNVFVNGGRYDTGIDALLWAKKVESLGAGEILLTSMDRDGTNKGYDIKLNQIISTSLNIPIIASGGAGNIKDIINVLKEGSADAALAASIFHYGKYTIKEVKEELKNNNIMVRI
jgi:imidazole glycerol-phosphate synthase subunit HisF